MPLLRGTLTYTRHFVRGDALTDKEKIMRAVRFRAMKPLEPDEEDLERSGWVKLGEPYETSFTYEDVFYDDVVNLGFRTDRWVLPTPVLRARVKEAEAAYLAKKGRERLSRKERADLKLLVAKKLRRDSTPAMRVVDFSWSISEGIVRFFSHAAKANAAMAELFKKSFGADLDAESPYMLAARLGLGKDEERVWNELESVSLSE